MKRIVCILVVLVLFLIAGAVPVQHGGVRDAQTVIFRTPAFVLLLLALGLCLVERCARAAGATVRTAPIILGAAALLALAVAALYVPACQPFFTKTPVLAFLLGAAGLSAALSAVKRPFRFQKMGFLLAHLGAVLILLGGLFGFLTEKVAQFALHRDAPQAVRSAALADGGRVYFGFGLRLNSLDVIRADPDSRSGAATAAVKQYEATLEVGDAEAAAIRKLAVNRPVAADGWRFYLMDYDGKDFEYVVVSARRDPGRNLALAGMYALIIGVAAAFYLGGGKHDD